MIVREIVVIKGKETKRKVRIGNIETVRKDKVKNDKGAEAKIRIEKSKLNKLKNRRMSEEVPVHKSRKVSTKMKD